MRTIIDLTNEQVKALDEISKLEETSRAALIRQAIDRMLAEDARGQEAAQAAFGLWSGRKKDGLEIEAALRRGKVASPAATPKAEIAPTKPVEVAPPPVRAAITEDLFVTTPPPAEPVVEVVETAPASVEVPPAPVPAPQREASMVSPDPLAAFFAGVKA